MLPVDRTRYEPGKELAYLDLVVRYARSGTLATADDQAVPAVVVRHLRTEEVLELEDVEDLLS